MNKSNTFDQQQHSRSLLLSHQGYLQGLQLSPPFAAKLYQWMEKFCILFLKSSGNLKNHLLIEKSVLVNADVWNNPICQWTGDKTYDRRFGWNNTLLCLLTCNKKLSNRLFSQSQLGQKGSKYYSNLFLFVYFQFLLESMSYYSFCNVLRTRKLAFIPYTQPIIMSMRSFICLVQLYFLP